MSLFCFAHAGGSAAAFRTWPASLPTDLALFGIQLPGRADRWAEPAVPDLRRLTDLVVEAMRPALHAPFMLFGHSMGAALAFEVARALDADGVTVPRHLVVSSRRAPSVAARGPDLHTLDEPSFVDSVATRYGGIPEELRRHPDVLAVTLPALRADLQALEQHRSRRKPVLSCPITAFAGEADGFTPPDDLQAWGGYTAASFQLVTFPGGHFYFDPDPRPLLRQLTAIAAGLDVRSPRVHTS